MVLSQVCCPQLSEAGEAGEEGIATAGPSLFRTYVVTLKSIVWKEYLKVLNTAL